MSGSEETRKDQRREHDLPPWDECVARLRAVRTGFDEDHLPSVHPLDDATTRAAIGFMRHLYTDAGEVGLDRSAVLSEGLDERAAIVIASDDDARRAFLDLVVFDASSPAVYGALAPTIRLATSLDDLVDAIVDRLVNGTDRSRANALDMQYYLFGRADDRPLGRERRRRIAAAVEELRSAPEVGEATAEALKRYVPPQDPVGP